jgi:DNA-directed RNA polymerase specialized sigma24 family protein
MSFPVELDDWIEDPKASEDGDIGRDMYGLQPFHPLPGVGMNAMPELRSGNSRGSLEALDVLFSRYRGVLSLIACRILGNHEQAEDAVQNCLRVASDHAPRLDREGAFRSWLATVLIDEAVTILNKQRSSTRGPGDHEPELVRTYESATRATRPSPCNCKVKADLPRRLLRAHDVRSKQNDELSRNINSLSST